MNHPTPMRRDAARSKRGLMALVLGIFLVVLGVVPVGAQTDDTEPTGEPDTEVTDDLPADSTDDAPAEELAPPIIPDIPTTLSIRQIDGTDPESVVVEFLYTGDRDDVTELFVRESGDIVATSPPVRLATSYGVALVIDSSSSMADNAAFERAVDAARSLVDNLPAGDEVAVIGANDEVQILQPLTSDAAKLQLAIDRLGVGPGDSLQDALAAAANQFDGSELRPIVIVITDGGTDGSVTPADTAQSLLDGAGAVVMAIGVGDVTAESLQPLVEINGGVAVTTDDPRALTGLVEAARTAAGQQFSTEYESPAVSAVSTDIRLTINEQVALASYTPSVIEATPLQAREVTAPDPGGIGFLQNKAIYFLALALILAAVAAAAFSLISVFVTDRRNLDSALQPYADGFVARRADEDGRKNLLGTNALLERAVGITGRFAERRGVLARTEASLERADLPLRAAEGLFLYLCFVVALVAVVALLTRNVMAVVLFGFVGALLPPAFVSFTAGRRRRKFNALLPDMLTLLAGTLRAGYSLMQGVEAAAQEVSEPMRKELQRVVTESRLGMPLETSLEGVAARMSSKDFEWAVMAIGIQREVGGNLAELLITVADTMTQRERLRRDIKSLTAEGRISAIVLGALPPGLGLVMYQINPEYMSTLFDKTVGNIALGSGLVLMLIGFYWMKKTIDIEV